MMIHYTKSLIPKWLITLMKTFLYATTLCILSAASGLAQKKSPLQTSYHHQLRNDDGGNGSVSVDRFSFRGGVPLITEEDNILAVGFRYAMDRYDFNGTNAEWQAIHHANIGLASRWQVNDNWLWGNYAVAGISAEEGSDMGDGLNFNFISIAEYKFNDRLIIGPGVVIASQLDQGINVIPIIAIKWQISDEWTFASGPSEVAAAGANVYFEYTPKALSEKWMFTSGFSYGSKNFKIDDNSFVTDGSGEERIASAYLAASFKMDSGVKISAVGGYHFLQSYSIFDNNGSELSKEILEDAPYFGIAIGFEF
jgi:hypothetical protein